MSPAETSERATRGLNGEGGLVPFLLDPGSYPHRPSGVRLIQTHASLVFIAPPFVYKVKKPVNFGFLDFSTLDKRRYFCEREVALNRRLCPGTYLGVVAISSEAGRLALGDGGEVVEYAVKMRELSDRHFLDKMVARGEVGPEELDRIAATLGTFYEAQHPTRDIEAWGQVDRLRISTDENFRQARRFIGQTLSRPAFEAVRGYTDGFYARRARLFDSRLRDHRIRDCHGDLHLEHVHLTPLSLNIYDCIEFNDRLRYLDVANDIAFLAMDLDFEGRPDLSRYFVAKMAARLRDPGMSQLMDFYKCYRAYVRGKVESLQSLAPGAPESERLVSAERARRYFRLALSYVLAGSEPLALVVMGRIASGKSTLARALGDALDWKLFSSDRVRKEMAGRPLHERGGDDVRVGLYSAPMTERTYERLLAEAEAEVRAGRSVILDATFGRRAHRDRLRERFGSLRVRVRFLEVQATDDDVKRRLERREGHPDEVSDARLGDFDALTGRHEPPAELAAGERATVGTSAALEDTVMEALQALSRIQWEVEGEEHYRQIGSSGPTQSA